MWICIGKLLVNFVICWNHTQVCVPYQWKLYWKADPFSPERVNRTFWIWVKDGNLHACECLFNSKKFTWLWIWSQFLVIHPNWNCIINTDMSSLCFCFRTRRRKHSHPSEAFSPLWVCCALGPHYSWSQWRHSPHTIIIHHSFFGNHEKTVRFEAVWKSNHISSLFV